MKYIIATILFAMVVSSIEVTSTRVAKTYNTFPLNKNKEFKTIKATIYAYNADEQQTDGSPCITANLYNICAEKRLPVIANNCLPFGTLVFVDNLPYFVNDRMNKRYGCEVFDILMDSYKDAIHWGKRNKLIKIYN